jgi:hypothetical protein
MLEIMFLCVRISQYENRITGKRNKLRERNLLNVNVVNVNLSRVWKFLSSFCNLFVAKCLPSSCLQPGMQNLILFHIIKGFWRWLVDGNVFGKVCFEKWSGEFGLTDGNLINCRHFSFYGCKYTWRLLYPICAVGDFGAVFLERLVVFLDKRRGALPQLHNFVLREKSVLID